MTMILTPCEIEARAHSANANALDICRRAGISYSTFTRWRSGKNEPQLAVYRRIMNALLEIEREQAPASHPSPSRGGISQTEARL